MSKVRALLRAILAITVLWFLFLDALGRFSVKPGMGTYYILLAGMHAGFLSLLAVDWAVCRYYWWYAKYIDPKLSFFWEFAGGVTWRELRKCKSLVLRHTRELLELTKQYPTIDSGDIRRAVKVGGILAGFELLLNAESKAKDAARRAEMERKCILNITQRAERIGCVESALRFAQDGAFLEAEAHLARCETLLARAREQGMDDHDLRELIAAGDIDGAEAVMEAAHRAHEIKKFYDRLRARVAKLAPEHRGTPQRLLSTLEGVPYGTRAFRKQLHTLEQALEGAERH